MALMLVGLAFFNIVKDKKGWPRKAFDAKYFDIFSLIYAVAAMCLLFMEAFDKLVVYLANGQSLYATGFSPYVGAALIILVISGAYYYALKYLARWTMLLRAVYMIQTERESRKGMNKDNIFAQTGRMNHQKFAR